MSLRESYRIFFQNIWMIVQEVDVKNTRDYSIINNNNNNINIALY